jgi:hypothetical protein
MRDFGRVAECAAQRQIRWTDAVMRLRRRALSSAQDRLKRRSTSGFRSAACRFQLQGFRKRSGGQTHSTSANRR